MKKHLKIYILLILILSIFSLYGCSSENASSDVPPDDSSQTEEPSDNQEPEPEPKPEPAPNKLPNKDVSGLPDVIDTLDKDDGNKLVLVNKLHTVSSSYEPTDMVAVDGSLSTNQGLYFKKEAYDAYLKMLADAKSQGIEFCICSTYRSYYTQEAIYNGYVSRNGAEYANTISAYPGRSEHHTGWAVDITSASMGYDLKQNFIEYPEGIWINNHCSEYGFIIRYPKDKTNITGYSYEPWHLRYVGVDVAKEITAKGLTLEEYLGTM